MAWLFPLVIVGVFLPRGDTYHRSVQSLADTIISKKSLAPCHLTSAVTPPQQGIRWAQAAEVGRHPDKSDFGRGEPGLAIRRTRLEPLEKGMTSNRGSSFEAATL